MAGLIRPLCFSVFSCLWLTMSVCMASCTRDEMEIRVSVKSMKQPEPLAHVNICVLGNSYSNDSFSYVPFILRQYGVTSCIHIYYRGSLSLHDLDEQWEDDSKYGLADLDGGKHNRLHFSIDTRYRNYWRKDTIMSAKDVVKMEKWDIITIQQGGNRCKVEDSYYPYLQNVIDRISSTCSNPYSLAWFMAYNGAKDNMNEESIRMQEKIVNEFPFDFVIPVATAIFSCQENEELAMLGDSKYHRMYASDNVHLQEGLPCYIAALTVSQAILDALGMEKSIEGDMIRPTQDWITSINGITQNGKSIGVTEENCALAQRAAIQANLHPFEIIPVQ